MIQPGTILGGCYEIMNHIGTGGMADVYKARCHKHNHYVAMKVLRQEYNEDEQFVKRFVAEAQATAGLTHPNIVKVYEAGHDQGYHYIVMELCEGVTLKRYIRRYGRLSSRETVDFSKQMARGLQAAHAQRIVHRDIKPQNILVSESGEVKVADFGIAKAVTGDTTSQNMMGSVHYLSPEQARGGFADKRSDIYSLGITMYEMATGRVPFDGENSVTIALMHLREEITPPRCYFPDIPLSLEKIILKCTMKRQMDRYQSAEELLADLDKVFSHPDGEYVFVKPMVDDSPTIHRSTEDLKKINESIAVEAQNVSKDDEDMKVFPGSKRNTKRIEENDPSEEDRPLFEESEEEEEEESMRPHMKRMIYAITGAGGILLAMILISLVISSTGILRFHKQESATQATDTTKATTEALTSIMPDVMKKHRRVADSMLEDNKLKARFDYEGEVDHSDKNLVVIKQEYAEGTKLAEGSTVLLTLGLDPEATTAKKRVEIPPLVNMTEEEAVETLEADGLNVEKIYASSDSIAPGYVIKQNPTAGTQVDLGFTITITISRGVSQVRVPSVTGITEQAAREQLNNVGLELGEVSSDYNGSVGVGEIFEQSLSPGTMVDKGSRVNVTVSIGERVSYHYEGQIYLYESPFEDDESGTLTMELIQDDKKKTIYSKSGISSKNFPLSYTFNGEKEGMADVKIYVNGEEYSEEEVYIQAVAD